MHNICGIPFSEITFHHDYYKRDNLSAVPCCGAWLNPPYSMFSIPVKEDSSNNVDVMSSWNSIELVKFRESILNGSYEYCKKESCPHWNSGKLPAVPPEAIPFIERNCPTLDYPPLLTKICIDRACNLVCPSCRNSKERIPNEKSYQRVVSIMSSGTKNVYINGSGELFINTHMMRALSEFSYEKYPNIEGFQIISNGTAFNKTAWYTLSDDLKKIIKDVNISVDSPIKETYSKLRFGGNFETTMKNLEFIAELRESNSIKQLTLTSVLQKDNISEIVDFINYAMRTKADIVFMNKIEYWGHKEQEYFNSNIGLPPNWRTTYKDKVEEAKMLLKKSGILLISNVLSVD